jgi:hypothetical protein
MADLSMARTRANMSQDVEHRRSKSALLILVAKKDSSRLVALIQLRWPLMANANGSAWLHSVRWQTLVTKTRLM